MSIQSNTHFQQPWHRLGLLLAFTGLLLAGCYSKSECAELDAGCSFDVYTLRQLLFETVTQAEHVYVAAGDGLHAFKVDPKTGSLTTLTTTPYQSGVNLRATTLGPGNNVVYAVENNSTNLYVFNRSADGTLTAAGGSPFAVGSGVQGEITMDATRTHIYLGAVSNTLAYTADASTGALTQVSGSPFGASCSSPAYKLNPAGTYLYSISAALDLYPYFHRDPSTGVLSAGAGAATAFTNREGSDIEITPSGEFLVAGLRTASTTNNLAVFSLAAGDGSLNEASGSPYAFNSGVNATAKAIAMSGDGKYVYAANNTADTLQVFSLDSAGQMSKIGNPYGIGNSGWDVQVGPGGKFLYVADDDGATAGRLYAFRIGSDGSLTQVEGSPVTLSAYPRSMAITKGTTTYVR